MLHDLELAGEAVLGTADELPAHIDAADLIRVGVERCVDCRTWVQGGRLKDGMCPPCRQILRERDRDRNLSSLN